MDRDAITLSVQRSEKVETPVAGAETPNEVGAAQACDVPARLGRYRITAEVGSGGFGVVYKGYDDELRRDVAIKVPHRERITRPEEAEAYLKEARVVASLDHAHIVPVFDVGRTDDGLCYVVSKFIEGSDLSAKIKTTRLAWPDSAELVATIAEALHHAHKRRLVHRDVKPANILIDTESKPHLADFGLALKEEDYGKRAGVCGTPAYMSPEQANGESHRVDGRSDIFSLSVVFYELLTGRRPFAGDMPDILIRIAMDEPRPPRQVDDTIPKELERICLKALSKRASDRYTVAKDMADDLRHFLDQSTAAKSWRIRMDLPAAAEAFRLPVTPASDQRPLKIVPKGLRSFDAHDADFFLELLPGPRDREGLPDSIRFWKTRVEEADPDNTFTVGLVYGPSGCGKSSLVKAGLLPRLSEDVLAVYLEATSDETETRLLNGLRKRCPGLPANLGVKDTLAALRRGQGLPAGKKVLIVLDQFEQWLHAKKDEENSELVQALRQCDGGRVQCIVMVRDDFWLAVSRFMKEVEIRLVDGQNSALVDLFDRDHARKVLAAFARAFGKLPQDPRETSKDQKQFLEQAVRGLAQEGKVICVRLALFAEMMKGRSWSPTTLKQIGGTEGVGVTFLEETFSAATAPPEHRYHQKAARAVLKALLPESGTDIKGHMRSHAELVAASGYASRPKDFDDLLRILNSEIRLITPTDPEGSEGADEARSQIRAGEKYYQLTHDYLVPSLRDWLTRKQKETRSGRAELLLADRVSVWNARPENRQLPSLRQWLQIRWLTQKKSWAPQQRKMMQKASGYHAVRALVVSVLLALLAWGGYEGHGRLQAHALLGRLLDADTNEVPTIVQDMAPYRRWIDPLLRDAYTDADANQDSHKLLHTSLALLPVDPQQEEYLYKRLLNAAPQEVPVLREALARYKEDLLDKLWAVVAQPAKGKEHQRLRAACALAAYDPEGQRWEQTSRQVVSDLVTVPAVYLETWMTSLRPVSGKLLAPLAVVFADPQRRETERSLATDILAVYAANQPQVLADLVMDAEDKQFAVLYPKLKDCGEGGLPWLQNEVDTQIPPDARETAKERLAKRQANAAVALLRMEQPAKVWPLLKHSRDPRVRSYLIHRIGPLSADPRPILRQLPDERDVTIRRALILSLGEFAEKDWSPNERNVVMKKLQALYRTADDPGLHASAEWLLRHWAQDKWLQKVDEDWAKDKEQKETRLKRIKQELTKQKGKAQPQWYVNGQGQTMVVLPGQVEFMMGSPLSENDRRPGGDESLHRRLIGRSFAIAAKPVTKAQFLSFDRTFSFNEMQRYPKATCPIGGVIWYKAAEYCNWLSKQEGIPRHQWCYETNRQGQYAEGMKLKATYLSLMGYRLPTEAEWEYACRARAATSRYYGDAPELLPKYGWYSENSEERTWPVGSLKPNDLGLFDMHGNVWCWCQERPRDYPQHQGEGAVRDTEDIATVSVQDSRVLRGGSFDTHASSVRSACRYIGYVPTTQDAMVGFRPARTFPTE
jgi:serine/threonine protein kinase/formylglycine-generating enzyme required for sulfatase activity